MHPQLFLKTFWRLELKPQIFVAMSFADRYRSRFTEIYSPAIEGIDVNGTLLKPHRVDLSKTGDSILTDIMDGIAHSQLVLADVSTVGKDAETKEPYRNSNVLYEVGLALACRQTSEVLLVRDDDDRFLFDVSTIPHLKIDFRDRTTAIQAVREALMGRLKERNFVNDARVQTALSGLSFEEAQLLKDMAHYTSGQVWGRVGPIEPGSVDFTSMTAVPRLLDKQLIKVVGEYNNQPAYHPTPLGRIVARLAKSGLPKLGPAQPDPSKNEGRPHNSLNPDAPNTGAPVS